MKRFASERVTGLMERLGLDEDGDEIAASCRRRSSSAQSRVEGFNFDIRKRVVEFDDVINKQRETIYAERDKVLHNEDLTETVRAFLDEEIGRRRDHLVGDDAHEWNLDGLSNALHAMGLDGEGTTPTSSGSSAARGDREHLRDLADGRSRRAPSGGRRGRLVDGRAGRPAADDRLAVGGAPDRARRHAPRHRPARLRPAGPAQRVPPRGVPAVRGAPGPHPPPGGVDDLPRDRPQQPAATGRRRPRRRGGMAGRRRRPAGARTGATARACRPTGTAARAAMPAATAAGLGHRVRCAAGAPQMSRTRELGDSPAAPVRRDRRPAASRAARPGLHADRRADRPQRPVLVRVGRQVQEVPRPLRPDIALKTFESDSADRTVGSAILPLGDRSSAPYTVPSLPTRTARAHGR